MASVAVTSARGSSSAVVQVTVTGSVRSPSHLGKRGQDSGQQQQQQQGKRRQSGASVASRASSTGKQGRQLTARSHGTQYSAGGKGGRGGGGGSTARSRLSRDGDASATSPASTKARRRGQVKKKKGQRARKGGGKGGKAQAAEDDVAAVTTKLADERLAQLESMRASVKAYAHLSSVRHTRAGTLARRIDTNLHLPKLARKIAAILAEELSEAQLALCVESDMYLSRYVEDARRRLADLGQPGLVEDDVAVRQDRAVRTQNPLDTWVRLKREQRERHAAAASLARARGQSVTELEDPEPFDC